MLDSRITATIGANLSYMCLTLASAGVLQTYLFVSKPKGSRTLIYNPQVPVGTNMQPVCLRSVKNVKNQTYVLICRFLKFQIESVAIFMNNN